MRNSQEVANVIKYLAKSRKLPVGKMLADCKLSINTLSSMQSGGYYPRLEAIAKIADYLECSVDYLLGRTNFPELLVKDNNSNYVPADFSIDDEMLIAADIKKSVFPKEEDETTIL